MDKYKFKKGDIYEISVVTEDNFCVMTCGTGVYAHRLEKVG